MAKKWRGLQSNLKTDTEDSGGLLCLGIPFERAANFEVIQCHFGSDIDSPFVNAKTTEFRLSFDIDPFKKTVSSVLWIVMGWPRLFVLMRRFIWLCVRFGSMLFSTVAVTISADHF